ncbi:MAG: indole-3-glycerol phosphate synthase, partial [Lachnospiraceae bacterium]|nr:indole-3-glycerol phosphate synthase [Lachnospiraceae bacterium]
MNILEEIAEKRRIDIENRKKKVPLKEIKEMEEKIAEKEKNDKGEFDFLFQKNLSKEGISFICEVKK